MPQELIGEDTAASMLASAAKKPDRKTRVLPPGSRASRRNGPTEHPTEGSTQIPRTRAAIPTDLAGWSAPPLQTDKAAATAYTDPDVDHKVGLETPLWDLDASTARWEPGTDPPGPSVADLNAEHLQAGTVLNNRYELEEHLGRSQHGVVYRACDLQTGDRVALKIIRPSLVLSARRVVRFRREVELMRGLDHPGIVRVLDVGVDRVQGLRYLTRELVEGISLKRWAEERRQFGEAIGFDEARQLVQQILETLSYAHEKTVHRALRPDIIFLVPGSPPQVKIPDFGLRTLLKRSPLDASAGSVYEAPEQEVSGAPVDTRADLYAVGVILYELLVGAPPGGPISSPNARRPELGVAVWALLEQAMDPLPDGRFQSASEFSEALNGVQMEPDTPAVETGSGPTPPAETGSGPVPDGGLAAEGLTPQQMKLAIALVVALAIVFVILLALLAARNGEPTDEDQVATGEGGDQTTQDQRPPDPVDGGTGAGRPVQARFVELFPLDGTSVRGYVVEVSGRIDNPQAGPVLVREVPVPVDAEGRFTTRVGLEEGRNLVFIQLGEGAGAVQAARQIFVDNQPPSLVVDQPSPDRPVRDRFVLLRGRAQDVRPLTLFVAGQEVAVDNGRFNTQVVLEREGENRIPLEARDSLGNVNQLTFRIVRDSRPPLLTVHEPQSGTVTDREWILVRGRVDDPHPSHVVVDDQWVELDAEGNFEVSTPLRRLGVNGIKIVAVDRAANEQEEILEVERRE